MEPLNWILVAIDFSRDSRLALQAADYQAARWGSGLLLVHVRRPHSPEEARLPLKEEQPLESWSRYVRRTSKERLSFMTADGEPGQKIVEMAHQYAVRKAYAGRGGDLETMGPVAAVLHAALPGKVELVSRFASQLCKEAA